MDADSFRLPAIAVALTLGALWLFLLCWIGKPRC